MTMNTNGETYFALELAKHSVIPKKGPALDLNVVIF